MTAPITRRQFVVGTGAAGLGLLAGCGRLPWQAQSPGRVPRIGVLAFNAADDPNGGGMSPFREALRDLGYVEGQNIIIEWRWAEGHNDRFPELAAELVSLPVDLIAAQGPAIPAAMKATTVIPIVMLYAEDPVANGWVASLAQPGGNVTGPSAIAAQLSPKRLQLLKEAVPGISRVGVLWHPTRITSVTWNELQGAAPMLGVSLQSLEVADVPDFESAFDAAVRERADAMIVLQDAFMSRQAPRVVELELRHRLPTMHPANQYVRAGGLMSYAPSSSYAIGQRAAYYVDRILKGAKPADLPVEQPMTFDFVVNLKTARELGITFPQEILLQVTEMIDQ